MGGIPLTDGDVLKLIESAKLRGAEDALSGEFDAPGESDFTTAYEKSQSILLNMADGAEDTPERQRGIRAVCGKIQAAYRGEWLKALAPTGPAPGL